MNPIDAFKTAILGAGLTPPDHIESGRFYKFPGLGKSKKNKAAWCILFDDLRGGQFGDYSTGMVQDWQAKGAKPYNEAELAANRAIILSIQKERAKADKAKHEAAAKEAADIWAASHLIADSTAHKYLGAKGIQAGAIRLIHAGEARQLCNNKITLCGNLLVIPLYSYHGLSSLQFISEDESDNKRPLAGGALKGCFYLIGDAPTIDNPILIVGEGFATCRSIFEATGIPTAMAIDSGNLLPACQTLQKIYPSTTLIIAADDDWKNKPNAGMDAAKKTEKATGGIVVSPIFPSDRPEKATDFNDLHKLIGLDAVKQCFDSVIQSLNVTDVMPSPWDDMDNKQNDEGKIESKSPFPDVEHRPQYIVIDDFVDYDDRKYKPGVYYCGMEKSGKDSPPYPVNTWVCSPIHIDAITHDNQSNNHGRFLRFKTSGGKWRTWSMPMELLAGDGTLLRAELLSMGVELDPYKKQMLSAYLQSVHPKRRMFCALTVGWFGNDYVLPDTVIGDGAASVIFQSGEVGHEEHTTSGTLQGWQTEIAARAVCNPILMIAISAAFAGPMLALCNSEGGGIHFVGDSSTGKSTAMQASCSVWGGATFARSWRSTANGMEGAAALFNDCLLALDEISEANPKEIGEIVYSLGNGNGKQRAGRTGAARSVTRWRCFVLSNGERTIETAMNEGGYRAKAGQSVRMLDLPVDEDHGAWNDLHGATSGAAFSDALKRGAAKHHGHAGRAFLEKLTRDKTDFCAALEEFKALPIFTSEGGQGQDKRAAARFAIVGMAGELATEYGLTGWPEGAAIAAASHGFKLWASLRGTGDGEQRQILRQVAAFIDRHGDGRFSSDKDNDHTSIKDRAGWWRDDVSGDREYLFNADGLREATKGFDFKRALDVLEAAGALTSPGLNKRSKAYRVGGRAVQLYAIRTEKLEGGGNVA